MKKIVIAGGAGFLGQTLARHFLERGWDVAILTRQAHSDLPHGRPVHWDAQTPGPWQAELEGAEALVNLCGQSVDCRYHRRNRERILQSRLVPTRLLAQAVAAAARPPKVWLNASSATIYRDSHTEPMTEDAGQIGEGFSVEVCRAWEDAFFSPALPATRRVALRAGMVLGYGRNSVYPVLSRIARLGLGGKIGPGNQLISWIHETDFARAVAFAIGDESIAGPLNVTAPAPVTNDVFMGALRASLGRSFGLAHYRPLLEIAAWLLRTETELTLKSRFAYPARLLEHRFLFTFPFVDEALASLHSSPAPDPAPSLKPAS